MTGRSVMVYVAFGDGRPVLTTTPQPGAAGLGSLEGDIALEMAACLVVHGLAETPLVERLVTDACEARADALPEGSLHTYILHLGLSG